MSARHPSVRSAIRLRPARLDDLDALTALEAAAFVTDRASRRAIRHAIASSTMTLLVAVTGEAGAETLVGAATIERRRGSGSARLSSIAVAPARAGQGIGGLLLDAAEADARAHGSRSLRLEVRVDNRAGIHLYEGRGYRQCGVRPDYYEDGTEAWRYEKALDTAA